jgi:hypothetical protein
MTVGKNKKTDPPANVSTGKPRPSLANTLMEDVNDRRPAAGKMTPSGRETNPEPSVAPAAPVEHGPERAKRDSKKK